MPLAGLTEKQKGVYAFIEAYMASRRRPPTLEEIREAIGARSINSAQKLVRALETKGYVVREKGKARSLMICEKAQAVTAPRPAGPEAAGVQEIPIRRAGAVPDSPLARLMAERLRVDVRFFRGIAAAGSCFAVRASDQAMQPDGIFRGDLVIAEPSPTDRLEHGEMVVCARRNEFLIRRLEKLYSLDALVASDPSFSTIHPDSVHTQVEGRVIAVMRRL